MNVPVDARELRDAYEWVSSAQVAAVHVAAYVHRSTGQIYWCGEGIDDAPPEDIEDGSLYIAVPSQHDLHLGRSLAFRFAEEFLPEQLESIHAFFHKSGAYSKLKSLLTRTGRLQDWYEYEEKATRLALDNWCTENGFVPGPQARGPGS